jgi:hypothetical protein
MKNYNKKITNGDINYLAEINPKIGPEMAQEERKDNQRQTILNNGPERAQNNIKIIKTDKRNANFCLPPLKSLMPPKKRFYLVKQKRQKQLTKE